MENPILQFVWHWQNWSYSIMFVSMFFDANIMILLACFLISQKLLNPYIIGLVVICGAYLEQLSYYFLGRHLSNKNFIDRWVAKLIGRYDAHLQKRPFYFLVITKFIYGAHRATLLRAGMLKIPFKKFATSSLKAMAIWLLIVSILGFTFSASYTIIKNYLKYAEFVLLGFLIIILIGEYFISKQLKKDL